jgi:UDP-2,4-diacetamido-2,4,6-trideoxy-beta-L-altropyranose hydrolase
VSFGGSDPDNETSKALRALRVLRRTRPVTCVVIAGHANPHAAGLVRLVEAEPGWQFHPSVERMDVLMGQADVALGAGGTTTWERCCVGLPALVTQLAPNQARGTVCVAEWGAIRDLGPSSDTTEETYLRALEALSPEALSEMSRRAMRLVDGEGADRVARHLLDRRYADACGRTELRP